MKSHLTMAFFLHGAKLSFRPFPTVNFLIYVTFLFALETEIPCNRMN